MHTHAHTHTRTRSRHPSFKGHRSGAAAPCAGVVAALACEDQVRTAPLCDGWDFGVGPRSTGGDNSVGGGGGGGHAPAPAVAPVPLGTGTVGQVGEEAAAAGGAWTISTWARAMMGVVWVLVLGGFFVWLAWLVLSRRRRVTGAPRRTRGRYTGI